MITDNTKRAISISTAIRDVNHRTGAAHPGNCRLLSAKDLRVATCRFPIGDERPYEFCGASAAEAAGQGSGEPEDSPS